jgi:hypothetical protein
MLIKNAIDLQSILNSNIALGNLKEIFKTILLLYDKNYDKSLQLLIDSCYDEDDLCQLQNSKIEDWLDDNELEFGLNIYNTII